MTPYIVAEVAQGYEGDVQIGRLLIKGAKAAGADAVKFQIIYADDVCVPGYVHYDLFRNLEMPDEDWRSLRAYAADLGIGFFGDVAGPRSLELAQRLDMDGTKIHSTCFFEDNLFDSVQAMNMMVLLSIGGIEIDDVVRRIEGLRDRSNLIVMHGFQAEPTPVENNNLTRIPALRETTGLEVGFMDHSDGDGPDTITLSTMALALGVRVFEKHITLDRSLELEDYVSGLAPAAFANYVSAIHRVATALGSADIVLADEEHTYRNKALKRIVARHAIAAGTVLSADDLVLLRPAEEKGLFRLSDVVGRTLRHDVDGHAPIDEADLG